MNLPIMTLIVLAFIAAYLLVIRYRPGQRLPLVVVSGIVILFLGLSWLSFGYRSFFIPVQALLFPDRVHKSLTASIRLPPHTVQTGRCSSTGSYYYSRNAVDEIDQFYRSQPSAEPGSHTDTKVEFRYGTSVIAIVQSAPGVSQLAIDCPLHAQDPTAINH